MKSIFNKEIDLDPDDTTIRELNERLEELQNAYTSEMLLNGEMAQENNELLQKIDKLTTTLVSYEATIGHLKEALIEIADEDFRGNRSSGSVRAYKALKEMGWRK